jgi:diguanylate cyclase (GGDEF)-like protein/PAS domain S-box-containing protein
LITDANAKILSVNKAFSKITGYHPSEVRGKTPSLLQSGIHKSDFYTNMWDSLKHNGSWQGEIWNKRKNGEIYPEWLSISKVEDQNTLTKNFYIAIFTDITNLKEADKKIYFYANHDHLTGLANRLNIESRFSHSIDIAKRKKKKVGLLFIDIDNFKDINDTYSHEVGDEVIKVVANTLESNLREEDTLGRIGGDEFLIIIGDIDSVDDVLKITQKIKHSFEEPFNINNTVFYLTLSIGVAIYPDHGENTDVLKQYADLAMYNVKINGRNGYSLYNHELSSELKTKVNITNDLRSAISNNELSVFYQPVIDYKTGFIIGAEALVRWIHPEKGIIPPMDFIHIAEEKGLISEVTAEVFSKVLSDLEKINQEFFVEKNFKIAVNISAKDFFSKNFSENLLNYFEGFDVEFSQIELEITETQIMKNHNVAIKIIESLKEKGFHFAIDDFGTGYSSLSYLKYFKIDKLKIDKSFILDAPYDRDDALIAKTIVDLAKTFKLKVQAEGVEESVHEDFVKTIGCDFGQGYFYSKPIKFSELCDEFIRKQL